MRHVIFEENIHNQYPVAILIKTTALKKPELEKHYLTDAVSFPKDECIGFSLKYNDKGKCTVKLIKDYLATLLPILESLSVRNLYVCDTAYFKVLANVRKADNHYGYTIPCAIKGFEHMNVVLGVNYSALFYNPDLKSRLDFTLETLDKCANGIKVDPGHNMIHSAHYPDNNKDIQIALEGLHKYPALTCDIETNGLSLTEAGVETIAFAWDMHNGLAFCVDRDDSDDQLKDFSIMVVRSLIKEFFDTYQGTLIYHNGNFDIKVLIYELWMHDPLDTEGMLKGIDVMTKNIEDTKIITYLATNSTAGNKLDLKSNSQEKMGNYGLF